MSPRSCSGGGASGGHSAGLRLVPCSRRGSPGPRVAIACADWPKGVTCKGGGGGARTRQHLRPAPARGTLPKAPPTGKVHARGSLGEGKALSAGRSALSSVQPDVLAVCCSAKDRVYSRVSSLSSLLSVVHLQRRVQGAGLVEEKVTSHAGLVVA